MKTGINYETYTGRRNVLLGIFVVSSLLLTWRVADLQVFNRDILIEHGDARSVRVVSIPAHRGVIADRNGEPLAISTPVASIWVTPRKVLNVTHGFDKLAGLLGMDTAALEAMLRDRMKREFVYLRRHVEPDLAQAIVALKIPGVNVQREYRRYYPAGEVTAHLLGFTNVDDKGQEGLELAFDHWLRGSAGSKRVLKDRLGHIIKNIESIRQPDPGRDLVLSIDQRIQYLAYRELKSAVISHRAKSGMLLLLDSNTGEVLSLAVQPSFNPNNRSGLKSDHYRNRVVTDVFEPGSTIKPFTIAAALGSGMFNINSKISTRPGFFKIGEHTIRDINNYGTLDVTSVIKKSSNVGTSKIALELGPQRLWETHNRIGFGRQTGSGYPGEVAGLLNDYTEWSELELATISFGYGLSVTTLQLAQAYSVLAADGVLRPATFIRTDRREPGQQVLPAHHATKIRAMMQSVVEGGGSGALAAVSGYYVAGKTGTVHKTSAAGYEDSKYLSLFAGIAPTTRPALVLIVVIDEPQSGKYFGGQVAAPVFAAVMKGALRILDIPPDNTGEMNNKTIIPAATMAKNER